MLWAIFVILVVMWLFGLVFIVHAGWVHPYPAIAGDRGTVDSCDSGSKGGVVVVTVGW